MRAQKDIKKRKGRISALSFLSPEALSKDRFIKAAFDAAREEKSSVFLVGGFVRNLALRVTASPDYDFVVSGDVKKISDTVSRRLGGTAFILDKETPSYRIVVKNGPQATLDFSPIKNGDINYDLLKRDFTVNAMAVDVRSIFEGKAALLDPSGGLKDAKALRLKAVSKTVFDEDPLRCLRAVRLSVRYGLSISPATLNSIKRSAGRLERTSAERIREELVAVFSSSKAAKGLRQLYELGIFDAVAPELSGWDDVRGYNLLIHALRTVDEAQNILRDLKKTFPEFHERLEAHYSKYDGPIRHDTFFIISAFLHDIGKPVVMSRESGRLRFIGHDNVGARIANEMLLRLRFSKSFSASAAMMVKNHHRVFMLAKMPERTFRAKAHLFRSVGAEPGIDLLLLSLADARATIRGEDKDLFALVREMLSFYYNVYMVKKPRPLMTGNEIMKTFKVAPGKIVGEIMAKIAEGVENGRIDSRREAVRYVRIWLEGKT